MPSPSQRVAELRRQIERHNHLYYVQAKPEITDREFDKLYDELRELEKKHPELVTPDSPTQRVGGQPIASFHQVVHRVPMLSIEKSKTQDELSEFDARVRKALGGEKVVYVVELKIDGVSMSLAYDNGLLATGVTRGDGEKGDDVTHNVRTIPEVPLRLHTEKPPKLFEARGEVYMTSTELARINKIQAERGHEQYANPRNTTAGTLKLLDPKLAAERKLRFFAYGLGAVEGLEVRTHLDALDTLRQFGFPVNPHIQHFDAIDGVIEFVSSWAEKRFELPYETDGMVIKVNDVAQQKRLGATGH